MDFTTDVLLSRCSSKDLKSNPKYRHINYATFDFLPDGSKDCFPFSFRIVRIKISDYNFETLVTNLDATEFSAEEIKYIYKLRWGIETSFRELKYNVGLNAFHSKKKDCMIQEIFASLIMYNFSMLITQNITIENNERNKYHSKVNHAVAIHICIAFFRSNHICPSQLEKQIARNKSPIRPNRSFVRKTKFHSSVCFNYKIT